MRGSLIVLLAVGLAQPALAADVELPYLRGSQSFVLGSPTYADWSGFYIGGQAAYSSAAGNFSNGTGDLIGYILRGTTIESEAHVSQWPTLPNTRAAGMGYGGFVGFNGQWDAAVIGVEVNYTRANYAVSAVDTLARSYQTSDNYFYNINIDSHVAIKVTDLGTLRLRGGWAADRFMPYGFIGLAVGRADFTRSATVALTAVDVGGGGRPPLALGPTTQSDNSNGVFGYGFAAGLGLEYSPIPHVFLRGEYEYVGIPSFNNVNFSMNTVRAAVGAKF